MNRTSLKNGPDHATRYVQISAAKINSSAGMQSINGQSP
jgi:hypothetical protein